MYSRGVIEGVEDTLLVEGHVGGVETVLSDGVGERGLREERGRDPVLGRVEPDRTGSGQRSDSEVESGGRLKAEQGRPER